MSDYPKPAYPDGTVILAPAPLTPWEETVKEFNEPKKEEKMMRANKNKPRLSYVFEFPNAMKFIAAKMDAGAKKYERGNWQKGAPVTELVDSLVRHLADFMAGVDKDADDGTHALAGVLTNACMLVETIVHHPDFDDRFTRPITPSPK